MRVALALLLALVPPARAGGDHAGLPLDAVVALYTTGVGAPAAPSFGTSDTGWSLSVKGGVLFAYVAPTAEALDAWVALQLGRQRSPPTPVEVPAEGVDAAWRRGTDFALLRDGNVGIMVQGTSEATEAAAALRALLVDEGPPWPDPPSLVQEADGAWVISAPGAVHVSWVGGRRLPGPGPRFAAPPRRVVAWDPLGRSSVLDSPAAEDVSGSVNQPNND
ncbi:hypothetical protein L6R53_19405 [Myxococcota bacterium]|nr:hypothetical protein [Myxococcota bacterium]